MTDKMVADRVRRMTEAGRDQSHANSEPKDAATLILIDRSGNKPKVLLGRRHHSHKFLPGKFVFPGGRIEPMDMQMSVTKPLHPDTEAKLMQRVAQPSAETARAFALASIRETFEETGLLLGVKRDQAPAVPGGLWEAFANARVHPDLTAVHFVARAITPPGRPKRFDTRFFTADAESIAHRIEGVVGPDSELVELVWVPIAETKPLDLPAITSVVLEELDSRVAAGFAPSLPVPFYYMDGPEFVRELL